MRKKIFALGSSFIAPQKTHGFGTIGAVVCKSLQANLVDYFGRNISTFRTLGEVSIIKWLLSPQNTARFERINVESIPGKKRPVAFRVDDPYCFDLCQTTLDCLETPVFVDHSSKEVVFDLTGDPFRHCTGGEPTVLRWSNADLMKYCTETDQSIIQKDIVRYLLRWEQALDRRIADLVAAKVGRNGNDEVITNIPLWVKGTNLVENINPSAVFYLNQIYKDMGQDGQFAGVGGLQVNKLVQFNKWVNNNDAGVDMSKTADNFPYMFYSRNMESVLGQDDFLLMAPGAVQLVYWNEFRGEKNREVTDLYTHSTVILPTTGLPVDVEWYYDYKCKMWIFDAHLHAEIVSVLPGGCGTNLANVNGIIRVHDCSGVPVIPVCPEPEA